MANNKEFYSKACVAENIRIVIDEAREESDNLKEYKQFSCSLTTILAKGKEVIAISLISYIDKCVVYIAKNSTWCNIDNDYIDKIMKYMKILSNNASITYKSALYREDVNSLFNEVMEFCYEKLNTRFKKLRNDI